MAHIHAHLMLEYAKDAAETDKPWERWEYSYDGKEFTDLTYHPLWEVSNTYRRKPRVILINGHEVPEPQRSPLTNGDEYFVPNLFGRAIMHIWRNDEKDNHFLQNGFVHKTEEAAMKHYEAIKSFTAKK